MRACAAWRPNGSCARRRSRCSPNLPTRKGGLRVPVAQWLRGELREYLLEHLQGQGSLTRSYYEPKALDRVIDDHLAGRRNHETALWTLLNLEIWHRNLLRA